MAVTTRLAETIAAGSQDIEPFRPPGSFDLYAASSASFSVPFTGLASKAHTVVVKVLGQRNSSSTGTAVAVDAFVVGTTTTDHPEQRRQQTGLLDTARQELKGRHGWPSDEARGS